MHGYEKSGEVDVLSQALVAHLSFYCDAQRESDGKFLRKSWIVETLRWNLR